MKQDVESTNKNSLYWMVQAIIIALTLIFAYAWSVQFNDPDPIFWCFMYGGAVFISVIDWMKFVRNRMIFATMGVLYASVLVYWMFRNWPWDVEEQREVGGLSLLILWASLSYWNHRSSSLMIQTG